MVNAAASNPRSPRADPSASSAFALLVASDQFDDPALSRLRGPTQEAKELAQVLADPQIGGFAVRTLINEPTHVIAEQIEAFFDARARNDLLLLYISCHGIKDEAGRLYFASSNTKVSRLAATGLSSVFVNEQMDRSRSRKMVLLLDCCYSGAFARGMVPRATASVDVQERFEGRGRAIITASTAMEYAFETEGHLVTGSGVPSVFTTAILHGLRTGAADLDGDGLVSVDELYDYVFRAVRESSSDQTPSMIGHVQGDLYLARRAGSLAHPVPSPARGPATGPEVGPDAGPDAGPQAGSQAAPEADSNAGPRAATQAGLEASPEAGLEVRPAAISPALGDPGASAAGRGGTPARESRNARSWPSRQLAAAALTIALVLTAGILLGQRMMRGSSGSAPSTPTPTAAPPVGSSSSIATPAAPTPGATASLPPGVVSQGSVTLADPTVGFDLRTGQQVFVFQSHLAWNGMAQSLSVFDETTLGAVRLPTSARFEEVTPAQLSEAAYQTGAGNPALSPGVLPPGRVLAVRLGADVVSKVTVVSYGPGDDARLRWVTYRVGG